VYVQDNSAMLWLMLVEFFYRELVADNI